MTLPPIAKTQLAWFTRYVRWYLRRNFHRLHLVRMADLEGLRGKPLLVCLNHASWWDPLIALYLTQRFFPERSHYAPIAAEGLAKYRFFERLGFFSAEPRRFVQIGSEVMRRPDGALWVTPQGRFSDVRQRPVELAQGVGHLAQRVPGFVMLPLAIEYAFWNERYPEVFACFGEPIPVSEARTAGEWTVVFSEALERTQDFLAARVGARSAAAFEPLLSGSAGVGGMYDWWRSAKARFRGKQFSAEHGGS